MSAFYNEIDPYAAAWLRNLIAAGHIAPGVVDERSIEDINPEELLGYTQCHFFAGIGVWSHALRLAGWPDDRPVWTGSCPCQPFSAAGKGEGTADERHLWPAWFHLIESCRPPVVFGEQVEAAIKHGWLDLVQSDLEGIGYATGPVRFPAAGVGAPHGRHRVYFVANTLHSGRPARWPESGNGSSASSGSIDALVNTEGNGCIPGILRDQDGPERANAVGGEDEGLRISGASGASGAGPLVYAPGFRQRGGTQDGPGLTAEVSGERRETPWDNPEWVYCRDGKWRPVEPGTFPLAHGAPARVGRLRAYGNAIVAPAAQAFISAYLEAVVLREMLQ